MMGRQIGRQLSDEDAIRWLRQRGGSWTKSRREDGSQVLATVDGTTARATIAHETEAGVRSAIISAVDELRLKIFAQSLTSSRPPRRR